MMSVVYEFLTIEKNAIAEYKDRGSRFIGYAFPLESAEDFKIKLASVKKEHPKASHHCFAYRLGTDGNNFRVSDDGEPSGSAGRPILGQIDSRQLTQVLIIVVRYFGGTQLGVPGLINAYKTVTSLALESVAGVIKPVRKILDIHFDYNKIDEVMRVIKHSTCMILSQELDLFCSMRLAVPLKDWEKMTDRLKEMGVEWIK
jgi:uncharacterized YigZ family protein